MRRESDQTPLVFDAVGVAALGVVVSANRGSANFLLRVVPRPGILARFSAPSPNGSNGCLHSRSSPCIPVGGMDQVAGESRSHLAGHAGEDRYHLAASRSLSRNPGEQSDEDAIVSTLLYVVTKVTVFAWGGWVAFNLLRVVALPYVYSQTRHYLISIGRDRPILADMAKEVVPAFLSQACLLAAPYIVYRSNRAPTASAGTDPSDTAPPDERSPDSAPDT